MSFYKWVCPHYNIIFYNNLIIYICISNSTFENETHDLKEDMIQESLVF